MKTLNKIKDYVVYLYLVIVYTYVKSNKKELNKIVKKYSKYIFSIAVLDENKYIHLNINYDNSINKYNIELDGITSIVDCIEFNTFILIEDVNRI